MTLKIQFTEGELLWMISNTSIFSQTPEGPNVKAMQDFRTKILSALEENGEISLTIQEMWIALETVQFSSRIETEKIGINMIHKLGKSILQESASEELHSAVANVGESETEGPNRYQTREKLAEFFDKEDKKNARDNDTNKDNTPNIPQDYSD